MLRLTLLIGLALPGILHAQAPVGVAPTSAAPVAAPTLHTIPLGLINAACTQLKQCGCGPELPACVDMYVRASLPAGAVACVARQPCPIICESENSGQPGTKLHAACLTPEAMSAASAHFLDNARVAACAASKRCGCEERAPNACAAHLAQVAPDVSGEFWACVANQPCTDVCDENTHKPGGGIHTRCMIPATEALMKLTAQTTQLMITLSSQMQQRMHQTTMGIIRNMAPSPTPIDVYDQNGNYLRSE